MKIADYISKSIQEYPSLYKDIDYEKSKLHVLDHIFFTVGNGLDMAETENDLDGGYIVDPIFEKNRNDDWIRVKDKPYGEETYKKIPDDYFDSIIYYVNSTEKPIDINVIKKPFSKDDILIRYNKKVDSFFSEPKLFKAENKNPFSPYPISKNCSIACEIYDKNLFLQKDWIDELVFLCEKTLEYFNDESQYINNTYYPNEFKINKTLNSLKKKLEESGLDGLNHLQEIWGFEKTSFLPSIEEITLKENLNWNRFRTTQIEILSNLINRYK